MKILTINTHSLAEEQYERKLRQFADMVLRERPDIIAMQEVNQSVGEFPAEKEQLFGYVPCPGNHVPVRRDNHAARAAGMLAAGGAEYNWTWLPAKVGYGRYDEGLALFSLRPIDQVDQCLISRSDDYGNWKTRRVVGIHADGTEEGWFYTVHMGWWDDAEEPFEEQWQRLEDHLRDRRSGEVPVWLMGDFNSPAGVPGEGWEHIGRSGWLDTYELAAKKDDGITVGRVIDGWREKLAPDSEGMRIDYVWCSRNVKIRQSQVVFNGITYPEISDHYGILVNAGDEEDREIRGGLT